MGEINYNIQGIVNAQTFIQHLYHKEERELRCAYLDKLRGFRYLISEGTQLMLSQWDALMLHGFHVTTQLDACQGIRQQGLLPLNKLLTTNCLLARVMHDEGIAFDFNAQSLILRRGYRTQKVRLVPTTPFEALLLRRLNEDSGISAFLSCPDFISYGMGLERQPEILTTLSHVLERPIAEDWTKNTQAYLVHFRVPVIDVDLRAMVCSEECERDLEEAVCEELLKRAFRVAWGDFHQSFLYLERDSCVPANEIIDISGICDKVIQKGEGGDTFWNWPGVSEAIDLL